MQPIDDNLTGHTANSRTQSDPSATSPPVANDDLEDIRDCLVNADAGAHAATEIIKNLPYIPSDVDELDQETLSELRRQLGRLQSLVWIAAENTEKALDMADQLSRQLADAGTGHNPAIGASDINYPPMSEVLQSDTTKPIRAKDSAKVQYLTATIDDNNPNQMIETLVSRQADGSALYFVSHRVDNPYASEPSKP